MLSCHVFVSDINEGNEDFGCKKVGSRFSSVTPRTERFCLDLPWASKKNMTWKWGRCTNSSFMITNQRHVLQPFKKCHFVILRTFIFTTLTWLLWKVLWKLPFLRETSKLFVLPCRKISQYTNTWKLAELSLLISRRIY